MFHSTAIMSIAALLFILLAGIDHAVNVTNSKRGPFFPQLYIPVVINPHVKAKVKTSDLVHVGLKI